jgi:hypothetical protein
MVPFVISCRRAGTLRGRDRLAGFADEILCPPEQRPGLVMIRRQGDRLGELLTCLMIRSCLQQRAPAVEARLRLQAAS